MIKINLLDLKSASASTILSLSRAYTKVFSTDPSWNEHWKCPRCCSAFARSHTATECHHCANEGYSVPLVEYWPSTIVLTDFYKEMSKKQAVCITATEANNNNEIVGFCWGYFVKINKELEEHLEAPNLIKSLKENGVNDNYVAYQDEIAVVPEYQGKGIAKMLFTERHQHFYKNAPHGFAIFRTLATPPSVTYKWMIEKLGYKVIHQIQSQNRTRVIAGKLIADCIQ